MNNIWVSILSCLLIVLFFVFSWYMSKKVSREIAESRQQILQRIAWNVFDPKDESTWPSELNRMILVCSDGTYSCYRTYELNLGYSFCNIDAWVYIDEYDSGTLTKK